MRFADCKLSVLLSFVSLLSFGVGALADDAAPKLHILKTPSGVRVGVLGEKPAKPAPTLFVFATSIEQTLPEVAYNAVGMLLVKEGVLSVGIDVPCHGQEVRDGEPEGINGWRYRMDRGEKVMEDFAARAKDALDYLIAEGYTDPKLVAAAGTSRGGFSALHFAAAEPRVKHIAAFAPLTNPLMIREFSGSKTDGVAAAAALANHAVMLADRSIWIVIGNHDDRVSTDDVVATARAFSGAAAKREGYDPKVPIPMELHLVSSAGHGLPPGMHPLAAEWLSTQIFGKPKTGPASKLP